MTLLDQTNSHSGITTFYYRFVVDRRINSVEKEDKRFTEEVSKNY
jgi:hypothetical protein